MNALISISIDVSLSAQSQSCHRDCVVYSPAKFTKLCRLCKFFLQNIQLQQFISKNDVEKNGNNEFLTHFHESQHRWEKKYKLRSLNK